MVRVRSFDAKVGVQIKFEATWGVDPGTWGTNAFRVAFNAEDFHWEDDVLPDSAEFTPLGALLDIDKQRRIVRGSLTCEPQYNNIYFWMLFSQVWGTENVVQDRSILDDAALATGLNTHIWTPGTATPLGLSMQVFMSGPDTSGSALQINGLLITRMVWDHPTGDRPTVTFEWIGKQITTIAATGAFATLESPNIKFKAKDLERTNSYLHFGATQTELNVLGFTLTVDRKVDVSDAFLNSLSTIDKPGILDTREVTIEIDSVLEQDFAAAQKPWNEFSANPEIASKASIGYEADTVAAASTNYMLKFDMPRLRWTDVRPTLTQKGDQPFTATGRATLGNLTLMTAPHNEHATVPTDGMVDIRAMCHVSTADETAPDAKFDPTLPNAT